MTAVRSGRAYMDPVEIGKVIGMSVCTTDDETAGDKRNATCIAFVVVDASQPAMLIEPPAKGTVRPGRKTDYWDIGVVAGRRDAEAAHMKLTLQAWLVQVRRSRIPAIDARYHERCVFDRDDRSNSVRGNNLAPADRTQGLAWHGQITW